MVQEIGGGKKRCSAIIPAVGPFAPQKWRFCVPQTKVVRWRSDMSILGSGYGYQRSGGGGGLRWIIALIIAVVGIIGYFSHTQVNPVTGEKQHISMTPDQERAL